MWALGWSRHPGAMPLAHGLCCAAALLARLVRSSCRAASNDRNPKDHTQQLLRPPWPTLRALLVICALAAKAAGCLDPPSRTIASIVSTALLLLSCLTDGAGVLPVRTEVLTLVAALAAACVIDAEPPEGIDARTSQLISADILMRCLLLAKCASAVWTGVPCRDVPRFRMQALGAAALIAACAVERAAPSEQFFAIAGTCFEMFAAQSYTLAAWLLLSPDRESEAAAAARRLASRTRAAALQPLLVETAAGSGKVQGMDDVLNALRLDEDGDAAHGFFEATSYGGFEERRALAAAPT